MQALIINLAAATDRMAFQNRQMAALGLQSIRLEAITPLELTPPAEDSHWLGWERPLTATEKAVYASHRRAWTIIAAGGSPQLVLEDDALLSSDAPSFIAMVEGLVGVDHITLEVRGRKKWLARQPYSGLPMRRLYLDRTGAAAYILWPEGAKKLLARTSLRPGLADGVICATSELVSYQAVPALAIQLDQCARYDMTPPCDTRSLNVAPRAALHGGLSLFGYLRFRKRRLVAQLRMGWRQILCARNANRLEPPLSANWPEL